MEQMYELLTPAIETPVSLSECKADLRIDDSFTLDDSLIESYILAASKLCSEIVGRKLIGETWKTSFEFVCDGEIELPFTPVQSIEEVQYYDSDNVSKTLSVSDFYLFNYDDRSIIEPINTATWPQTYSRRDAISITFITGMGADGSAIPETIKRAIRLTVAHWYEHRTAVLVGLTAQDLPMGVEHCLNVERIGWCA
uniref:PhiE125 gp8 protein n=1 Tax=uncultured marine virus TaxID=186617 RepID=A0A0F7L420_9VIRU|nr:phiE125 gp8 protein [uncultured marine virus]